MPASFPGSLYTAPVSHAPTEDLGPDVAQLELEMEAVQAELETAPSGSFTTVKDRLEAIEADITTLQTAQDVTDTYSVVNETVTRSLDANSYTMDTLADLVCTLIEDLQDRGIIGG